MYRVIVAYSMCFKPHLNILKRSIYSLFMKSKFTQEPHALVLVNQNKRRDCVYLLMACSCS